MDALQLLDYDCWEEVFQNLRTEDLLNCRLVCKPFNKLLDLNTFQSKWKFPAILPLIFDHLRASKGRPWRHLCSLRLTCQSWRHTLEKYTSDVYASAITPFSDPLESLFQTEEEIEEFQERFGELEPDINPFPSKIVVVSVLPTHIPGEGILSDAYVNKIGNLFKQFGRHISKLILLLPFDEAEDHLSWCKLVRWISIHLANLKVLTIGKADPEYDDEYEYFEEIDKEIDTFIEENALAELPQLQELRINGLKKKVEDYLLEKYAPQLTHLKRNFQKKRLPQVYAQEFKNLRKLSLEFLDGSNDTLEMLQLLESPLKYLKLHHSDYDGHEPFTWNVDKVLRNIKHLPLESLKIHLSADVEVVDEGLEIEEYRNESIQTLSISLTRRSFSFNFLQALTKLETVKVKYFEEPAVRSHPGDLTEVVKLNEYLTGEAGTDLPYQSNIWEKVPSLKTLTFKRLLRPMQVFETPIEVKSIYRRENYERIKMNQI